LKSERPTRGERALVIMAKAARPGHVKTRLADSLSPQAIIELYKCLIEDTVQLARSVTTDALAIVCPFSDVADLSGWLPDMEIVAQEGNGLAAGLVSAFRVFIGRGYRHVIALDGDSPQIPCQTLEQAFRLLDSSDVVVGPTIDGGYYLVGATALQSALFDHHRIGTGGALDTLLGAARTLNLKVALTETAYDVDEPGDLARLSQELDLFPSRAPRTARWLARGNMRE
jgi:rSAM/selenodomain-associated transferase 1